MYSDTNGNCTFCEEQCDKDVNCLAIECGLTNCLGWKNGKCSDKQDMGIATRSALQTCIKTFDVTSKNSSCTNIYSFDLVYLIRLLLNFVSFLSNYKSFIYNIQKLKDYALQLMTQLHRFHVNYLKRPNRNLQR